MNGRGTEAPVERASRNNSSPSPCSLCLPPHATTRTFSDPTRETTRAPAASCASARALRRERMRRDRRTLHYTGASGSTRTRQQTRHGGTVQPSMNASNEQTPRHAGGYEHEARVVSCHTQDHQVTRPHTFLSRSAFLLLTWLAEHPRTRHDRAKRVSGEARLCESDSDDSQRGFTERPPQRVRGAVMASG
jgi:hypothetical protein